MSDQLASASVLVVEDEAFSQQFIVQLLKGMGVGEIATAGNGQEALDLLAERQSAIDLVIPTSQCRKSTDTN